MANRRVRPPGYAREQRAKHIEKRREYDRRRYHEDAARRAWQKAQATAWRKANPGKVRRITAARRAWIKKATPAWLTDEHRREIAAVYAAASELGPGWHVDHIEPVRAKDCCGLHVPWNLQIIPALDNIRKSNRRASE